MLKLQLWVWFTSLVFCIYLLLPTAYGSFQYPKFIWELTSSFQFLTVVSPSPPDVTIPGVSAPSPASPGQLPLSSNDFISMAFWNLSAWTLGLTLVYADSFMFEAVLSPIVFCVPGYWIGCVWTLTRRGLVFLKDKNISEKTVYLHYPVSFGF